MATCVVASRLCDATGLADVECIASLGVWPGLAKNSTAVVASKKCRVLKNYSAQVEDQVSVFADCKSEIGQALKDFLAM